MNPVRSLSVVIPFRDAEATLADQLEALADQRWPAWEVVLADNGSRDGSRRVAQAVADRLPGLRIVDAGERPGSAYARNRGAAAARGDALAFCDADDVVGEGWLPAMANALGEHPLVASRFDVRRLNAAFAPFDIHPQSSGLNPYDYPPFLPHAGGSGLGVRREIHERLGGFDESYPCLEDTDYCFRCQLAGVPLWFAGDALVHVRLRREPGALFRQMRRFGKHNVQLYARYRERGMPRLGALPGTLRWAKLGLRLPMLVMTAGRRRWIAQLGWRLGRLEGCVAYRVLAP
jgi:GT2 family glycosyltransferase